jgi:hypothetical protein
MGNLTRPEINSSHVGRLHYHFIPDHNYHVHIMKNTLGMTEQPLRHPFSNPHVPISVSFMHPIHFASTNSSSATLASSDIDVNDTQGQLFYELLDVPSSAPEVLHSPYTQSPPRIRRNQAPVEYHPPAQGYAYLEPQDFHTEEDEAAVRLDAMSHWHWRIREIRTHLAAHPDLELAVQPVVIWRVQGKKMFQMKSIPQCRLQTGDRLECFGLLVGEWVLTSTKKRLHRWTLTASGTHGREWVRCLCVNHNTEQKAWIEVPAHYYYPSSITMRVKKAFQRLGSLFNSPSYTA